MAASSSGAPPPQLQSYSQIAKKTANNKVVQVTLVRYRPSINYNLSSLEISKLAYKKLLIPQGGLEFVDDSEFRTLKFYLKPNVDTTKLNLNEAFEIKPGLRTKPVSLDKRDTWINVYWTSVETDNRDIEASLSYFGRVTMIEHMTYKSKSNDDALLKQLDGVKKGDRRVKIQIHRNIPSYIIIAQRKVKVTYEGQTKTCRRCHSFVEACPGDGDIDRCEEAGVPKTDLDQLWDSFIEQNEPFTEDEEEPMDMLDAPRARIGENEEKCFELSGFPADASKEIIIDWLNEYCDVQVDINDLEETQFAGRFIIRDMARKERQVNAKKIKDKEFTGGKIYVNVWTPSTPAKEVVVVPSSSDSDTSPDPPSTTIDSESPEHVSETDTTEDKTPSKSVNELKKTFEMTKTQGGSIKYQLKELIDERKKEGNKRVHESSTPDSEVDMSQLSKSQRKKMKKRQKKMENDLKNASKSDDKDSSIDQSPNLLSKK